MNCREALAQLELSSLAREAGSTPDSPSARRHLAECPACRQAYHDLQKFDREMARTMTDVAVPQGLTDRLLAAVDSVPSSAGINDKAAAAVPGRGRAVRRPFLWGAAGLVVAILAVFSVWIVQPRPMLTEKSVGEFARLDINALPAAREQSVLPQGWSSLRGVRFGESSRMAVINGVEVPVQAFVLQVDRKLAATGILTRIQPAQWQSAPDATSFDSATVQYAPFGAWVAWREGDVVFVCIVQENAHAMQRLQELVAASRRFT